MFVMSWMSSLQTRRRRHRIVFATFARSLEKMLVRGEPRVRRAP